MARTRSARALRKAMPLVGAMRPGSSGGATIRTSCCCPLHPVGVPEPAPQSLPCLGRPRLNQPSLEQRLEAGPIAEAVVRTLAMPEAAVVPLHVVRGRVQIRVVEVESHFEELLLVLQDLERPGQIRRGRVLRLGEQALPAVLGRAGAELAVEDVVEIVHEGAHGRQLRVLVHEDGQTLRLRLFQVLACVFR